MWDDEGGCVVYLEALEALSASITLLVIIAFSFVSFCGSLYTLQAGPSLPIPAVCLQHRYAGHAVSIRAAE
jgi:hypothetical protein